MEVLIILAIYNVISLGMYFACSWFSKEKYDNFDMMAANSWAWILFPVYFGAKCLVYGMMFVGEHIERLKNKMLEYKKYRTTLEQTGQKKYRVVKETVYTGAYIPPPGKDPFIIAAEEEVEQLLKERQL